MSESFSMLDVGQRYTFCMHYPEGYREPFECEECKKVTYEVVAIVDSITTDTVTFTVPNEEIKTL